MSRAEDRSSRIFASKSLFVPSFSQIGVPLPVGVRQGRLKLAGARIRPFLHSGCVDNLQETYQVKLVARIAASEPLMAAALPAGAASQG